MSEPRITTERPVLVAATRSPVEADIADPRLLELAERAEQMESLSASVEEMKAGKGRPIEEMLAEMKQILVAKQAR